MRKIRVLSVLVLTMVTLWSCTPDPLAIGTIVADGMNFEGTAVSIDLNGATSAEDVPLDAVITVSLDREVDTSTVTTSTVTLSDADGNLTIAVSASGMTITVDPEEMLTRGTDYTLMIEGVLAMDEGVLASISRTFKTEGRAPVVVPNEENMVAYWSFDNSTDAEVGDFPTANEVKVSYGMDRFDQAASALSFDGDESLVEVSNGSELLNTNSFTMSFWIKSDGSDVNENDETRGQFVMGCAAWNGFQFEISGNYGNCKLAATYTVADDAKAAQDLWWSTKGDLGWQGWTYDKDVTDAGGLAAIMKDKWTHVLCTYDAATKIGAMYINGELVKSQDFNLYGDTHALYGATGMGYNGNPAPGDRLAFGFIQGSADMSVTDDWANPIGFPDNNHFKGLMDDVRFFNAAFSADDVEALYNAESN